MTGINPKKTKKTRWKNLVNEKVHEHARKELLERIRGLKKLNYEVMQNEKYEVKGYLKTMTLEDSRLRYRTRINLVPGFKYLYKNDPAFRQS